MPKLELESKPIVSIFYPYMSSPLHTTGELVMSEAPTRKKCFPRLQAETQGVDPEPLALA